MKLLTTTSTGARDLRFDTLRGLMLVMIAVDHIGAGLRMVTDQPVGFASAAEGFVFLAGLMAGLVFTKTARRRETAAGGAETGNPLGYRHDTAAALAAEARRRAGRVYLYHLGSFAGAWVLLRGLAACTGHIATTEPALFYTHPALALILGPLLLYQPGLLDILPMYCVFLLVTPLILRAAAAGDGGWVIALSVTLWVLPQFGWLDYPAPGGLWNFGSFNLFAWQLPFVGGVLIGRAGVLGRTLARPLSAPLLAAALGLGGFLLGVRHGFWPGPWSAGTLASLVNRNNLGLLRLLNFTLLACLLARAAARQPRWFTSAPLALLGQHSIVVFAFQTVAILLVLAQENLLGSQLYLWLATLAVLAGQFPVAAWHARRTPRRAPASGRADMPGASAATP